MGKNKIKREVTEAQESPPKKKTKASKVKKEPNEEPAAETDVSMAADANGIAGELKYSDKLAFASPIAQPMAGKKLTKKLLKLLKSAVKETGLPGRKDSGIVTGLKSVQVGITRKNERGLVIFAGNVTPIDVMSHLPAVCEDRDIPYVYVPLKSDISQALGVRRTTIMVLVRANKKYEDAYTECLNEVKSLFPLNL